MTSSRPSSARSAIEAAKVIEVGGLYVLGTERHESRRIDNQLRGRSGRQGDPGESRFYLSLQDDLMRLFNSGAAEALMGRSTVPDDIAIESKVVSRAIRSRPVAGRGPQRGDPQERAQVRRRAQPPARGDLRRPPPHPRGRRPAGARRSGSSKTSSTEVVEVHTGEGHSDDWDLDALWTELKTLYPIALTDRRGARRGRHPQQGHDGVPACARCSPTRESPTSAASRPLGEPAMRELERRVVLSRSSTAAGATTSTRWTTSRTASACARWRSATRSSSTSARASRCTRR